MVAPTALPKKHSTKKHKEEEEEEEEEGEEEEVYVCRRLYHSIRQAFLPLGAKAMQPEVRPTHPPTHPPIT